MATKKKVYSLTVSANGKEHKASGTTALEALEGIKADKIIKTRVLLSLKKDNLKSDVLLFPIPFRKAVSNGTGMQLLAKRLSTFLK